MSEHEKVKGFISERWDGLYNATRCRDHPDGTRMWEGTLHGPNGPKVFVGVKDDGRMIDLTR